MIALYIGLGVIFLLVMVFIICFCIASSRQSRYEENNKGENDD